MLGVTFEGELVVVLGVVLGGVSGGVSNEEDARVKCSETTCCPLLMSVNPAFEDIVKSHCTPMSPSVNTHLQFHMSRTGMGILW